ncbi:hypothetical protein [Nitratireductor thuwali]|uniref:Lipoprotein n=1 Tax=Nitratireductor thuwali TaxID=2267699 RepID=A0ABY5MQT3_9HYPH|nr:hypothetical protein NTH_02716 [Nitratireductor thuwali]
MIFLRLIPFLAFWLMMAGCASDDRSWVRDDTPRSDVDQALAECKYQAEAATIGIGANNHHPRTWGDAIGDAIGDGIIQGMDEAELVNSCMQAKGFRR